MYRYDKWMDDEIDIKEYSDRQKDRNSWHLIQLLLVIVSLFY